MNKVVSYYESIGDRLAGKPAERAYRTAQNAISYHLPGALDVFKRIQNKLITNLA